jgi:hypothetical protein
MMEDLCGHAQISEVAARIPAMPVTSAETQWSSITHSKTRCKLRYCMTTTWAGKVIYIAHNWKLCTCKEEEAKDQQTPIRISLWKMKKVKNQEKCLKDKLWNFV